VPMGDRQRAGGTGGVLRIGERRLRAEADVRQIEAVPRERLRAAAIGPRRIHHLHRPAPAAELLEAVVKKHGLRGAGMGGSVNSWALVEPRVRPFGAKAESLGVLVFTKIAMENTDAVAPAHPVPRMPKAAYPGLQRCRALRVPLTCLARLAAWQSLCTGHVDASLEKPVRSGLPPIGDRPSGG